MTNPFESIELRLCSIEQELATIVSLIKQPVNQNLEDSIGAIEAAKVLQIPLKSLYIKTHKKLIPHSKIGKRLLFSRAILKEYIASNTVKTIKEELLEQHKIVESKLRK